MTRPALAHSNLEPIQAVLPHAEADKTPCQPFFKRVANVQAGSPEAKAVLLAHAAFCEVYIDGLSGTCLASGETIRALSEVGRRRFWQLRRDLLDRGHLVVKRRQAGRTATVEVRATPDLLRAVDRQPAAPATGPEPSERRTQATLDDLLSRYPRGSHLVVTPGGHTKVPSKPERTSAAPDQGAKRVAHVQVRESQADADRPEPSAATKGENVTHQDRPVQCRGCMRESKARTVRGQTCDKCEHSTDDERRIVRDKVRAKYLEHQKGWLRQGAS